MEPSPIAIVYGTRPEAIKLGPVVAALRAHHVPIRVIATDQHTTLLQGTPAQTDLADGLSLGVRTTGEVMRWPRQVEQPLRDALRGCTVVAVQGDTMSAWAGARAAVGEGIPVVHIEAGLRSGDLEDPWPEEAFRREISRLASFHYCPTPLSYVNLAEEGVPASQMTVTGNSVVSAMARYSDVEPVPIPDLTILFTMHRREWRLGGMLGALRGFEASARAYPEVRFIWPVHPGVLREIPPSWVLHLPANVQLCDPLAYRPMLRLLARSLGIATDSGGLQEEAATLGVPCAVLRKVTDRPESVELGLARVYAPTEEGVIQAIRCLREQVLPRVPSDVFGNVGSAERIADHLATFQAVERIASTSS